MTSTKSISKSELAIILGVSISTIKTILNIEIFEKIEPLGYIKGNKIIRGRVLEYIKNELCFTDADILEVKKPRSYEK
ncbi:MAG: hypothetical protein WC389_12375 [Lutibacter sp.]|jgi:hypothetical protein